MKTSYVRFYEVDFLEKAVFFVIFTITPKCELRANC